MTIWHRPRHGEIPNSLLDLELPLEPPQLVVWSIRTGYVPRPSITTLQSRPPPGRRLQTTWDMYTLTSMGKLSLGFSSQAPHFTHFTPTTRGKMVRPNLFYHQETVATGASTAST